MKLNLKIACANASAPNELPALITYEQLTALRSVMLRAYFDALELIRGASAALSLIPWHSYLHTL